LRQRQIIWLGPGEFAEETVKNFSIGATYRL
jgi:hypothetical protein